MNKLFVLTGLALFFVFSSIGTAYGAIYVMIPDIKGDVTAEGHDGWIELDSLSDSIDRELKSSGAKGGTSDINIGIAQISEIVITKGLDSSSASLTQAAMNGNSLGEIKFCLVEESISGCYQTYELARSFVKSWSTSGDADDRPTEEVAFYFNSIRIIQYTYDGKEYQETSRAEWDLVKNTPTYSGEDAPTKDTVPPAPLADEPILEPEPKVPVEPEEKIIGDSSISPLKQIKIGVLPTDIACKSGFELILKPTSDNPACVKSDTALKLISRGWTALFN